MPKLVGGFSVAPTGCNRPRRGEACCWVFWGVPRLQSTSPRRSLLLGFQGHPPAAIDLAVGKLVVGFSGAPPGCSQLLRGEACCWVFRTPPPPRCSRPVRGEACCWDFGCSPPGTPRLQSTSLWRSLLLGFRGHRPAAVYFFVAKLVVGISGAPPGCNRPRRGEACCWVFGGTPWLQLTSPWGSLLLGFREHPPAAVNFFVAKLVVGCSGAPPPSCSRPLRGEACCWDFGCNPPGTPRLQSTSLWRSLLLGFRGHRPAAVYFFVAKLVVGISGAPPRCNRPRRGEACCWVFGSTPRLQSTSSWRSLLLGVPEPPPQLQSTSSWRSLLLGFRVQPPGHPPVAIDFFVAKLVVGFFGGTALLQSTSSWRSLLLGFREHPRLQSTSPWRSLLLGFRGHPLAAIDLAVGKLVVGFSGAPPGCSQLLRGEACCWVFRSPPPPAAVDLFVAKLVVGISGATPRPGTPRLQSTSLWRSLLLGFRGHRPAAVYFFVAKLVVGISGAPTGCNRPRRGEACCRVFWGVPRLQSTSPRRSLLLGFQGHPPAAIDLAVAKHVVGFSGAPPGCNRLLRGEACCWVFRSTPPAAVDLFVVKLVVGISGAPPGCNRPLRGEACCCVFGGPSPQRLQSTSSCRSLLLGFRRLLRGAACCWDFGGTPRLQSTSPWRSLSLGVREHPRLQSTSPWRSLLLGFRGHPLAAIDLFVAKLAVGFLEATPRLQSTSSWRSLLLGFRGYPPAAIDFFVGEACSWVWVRTPQSAGILFIAAGL